MKKHVNPSKYCLKKKSFALLTVVFLAKQPWAGNSTLIAKPLSASEFRLHASLQAKSWQDQMFAVVFRKQCSAVPGPIPFQGLFVFEFVQGKIYEADMEIVRLYLWHY